MKSIVCDVCGSNDLIKQGEYYICNHCGTKHLVEYLDNLEQEESNDNIVNEVDEESLSYSDLIRHSARNALDSENYWEAKFYYSKILDSDPEDWEATFYKTYCEAWDGEDYLKGIYAGSISAAMGLSFYRITYGNLEEKQKKDAYTNIGTSVVRFFNYNLTRFSNNLNRYPVETIRDYVDETLCPLIEMLLELGDQFRFPAKDYKKALEVYSVAKRTTEMTSNSIATGTPKVKMLNRSVDEHIKELDKAIKEDEADEYWKEHPTELHELRREKDGVEKEIEEIQSRITDLNSSKNTVPAFSQLSVVRDQVSSLSKEKDSLGIFKIKEKKSLQAQIDTLKKKANELDKDIDAQQDEINKKIKPLETELREKKTELKNLEYKLLNPQG